MQSGMQGDRSSLLAAGLNYGRATGDAFSNMNASNRQAQMSADQFNISNQGNVAGINQQALNQAGMFNTQNQNIRNQEDFQDRRDLILGALNAAGQIGTEKSQSDMFGKVHGYDSYEGRYLRGQKTAALGGPIKTKKRSLL